jgi:Flp pilus assembly protein TadG
MRALLARFQKSRRGAIAVIFSLCLVPLVLLVGLTVDYSFYVEARAQAQMAADAAVTHAVRAADETYTYELGVLGTTTADQATASADAIAAGEKLGADWFYATLGMMPKASIAAAGPSVIVAPNSSGQAAGFTASVNFAGIYPPFFKTLFNGQNWNINGASTATSAYDYVEILMLLDNSASMLIGATVTDIQSMEAITVCPPTTINLTGWSSNDYHGSYYAHVADPNYQTDGNPWQYVDVPNANITHVSQYGTLGTWTQSTDGKGYSPPTCATGWKGGYTTLSGAPDPLAPCAFACHTTTSTLYEVNGSGVNTAVSGYTNDAYGLAEHAGVTLRLNVMQSAAAQVISAMETNEQAAGQFSVGVYEFNTDVVPVYPTSASGTQAEAGTDLPTAESDIQNAAIPIESNPNIGYSNFPTSVADLISGAYSSGTAFGYAGSTTGLTAAGNGASASSPQKDIFIVTDGLEDATVSGSRYEGEMTGYTAETASTEITATPWVCEPLKKLGFTVYVLYIDYEPLANTFYQTSASQYFSSNAYLNADYPALAGGTTKQFAESTANSQANSLSQVDPNLPNLTPDETGLLGCASSPGDFFEASSSTEINTALEAMLASAMTSAIQLTH